MCEGQQGKGIVVWAAFLTDVVHEVLPVTDGVRIAMLYHLHRDGSSLRPLRARPMTALPPLAACLKDIATVVGASGGQDGSGSDSEDSLWQSKRPAFVGILLEHAYGGVLSAEKLQGLDRMIYDALAPFLPERAWPALTSGFTDQVEVTKSGALHRLSTCRVSLPRSTK
eukprot:SRR837773.26052.p1 GENE.SRR837773.26052~~SRR837773.26052.p1  ORF type:complete len:169 (-),score=6.61 SRR837773.26052:130-636(-)